MRSLATDPRIRALAKAVTHRLLGSGVTAACAWLVTGEATWAASIGALDTLIKCGGECGIHTRPLIGSRV